MLLRAQRRIWEGDRDAWEREQPLTTDLATHLTLQPVIDDRLPTALCDGRRIFFNARTSAGLDGTRRHHLQAHLVWHCALGHLRPSPLPDLHRWHLACDQEVNAILLLLGFRLPDDAVLFPACIGQSLEQTYAWLDGHPDPSLESVPDLAGGALADPMPDGARDPQLDPRPPDPGLLLAWEQRLKHSLRRHAGSPQLAGPVAALLASHS